MTSVFTDAEEEVSNAKYTNSLDPTVRNDAIHSEWQSSSMKTPNSWVYSYHICSYCLRSGSITALSSAVMAFKMDMSWSDISKTAFFVEEFFLASVTFVSFKPKRFTNMGPMEGSPVETMCIQSDGSVSRKQYKCCGRKC